MPAITSPSSSQLKTPTFDTRPSEGSDLINTLMTPLEADGRNSKPAEVCLCGGGLLSSRLLSPQRSSREAVFEGASLAVLLGYGSSHDHPKRLGSTCC